MSANKANDDRVYLSSITVCVVLISFNHSMIPSFISNLYTFVFNQVVPFVSSYMSVHINIYIDTNIDCMTNYMYEKLLYCAHVWMAPGKISCKLTVSPSLNNF